MPSDLSPGSAHCTVGGYRGGSGGMWTPTPSPMARRNSHAACLNIVPRTPEPEPTPVAYVPAVHAVGEPFDPRSLEIAARFQFPEMPELARALACCTQRWPENDHCDVLVPPERGHLCDRIPTIYFLTHHTWGELALHVVNDRDAPEGITIVSLHYLDRMPDDDPMDPDLPFDTDEGFLPSPAGQ
jgi:hypothetical protein